MSCHHAAAAAAALYTAKLESETKTVSAINFYKSINYMFCVLPGHEVSICQYHELSMTITLDGWKELNTVDIVHVSSVAVSTEIQT